MKIQRWDFLQDGEWTSLKNYVAAKTGEFQPGLCVDCSRARLPEHVPPAAVVK